MSMEGGGLGGCESVSEFTVTVVEFGPYISGTNGVVRRVHAIFEPAASILGPGNSSSLSGRSRVFAARLPCLRPACRP